MSSTSKYYQSGNEVSLQVKVMLHTVTSHTAVALQKNKFRNTRVRHFCPQWSHNTENTFDWRTRCWNTRVRIAG